MEWSSVDRVGRGGGILAIARIYNSRRLICKSFSFFPFFFFSSLGWDPDTTTLV